MFSLWLTTYYLAHPSRRPLQAYHKDWLYHPTTYGLKITAFPCANGSAPCLFVSPDQHAGIASRGTLLRQQLSKAGIATQPYGQTHGILVLLHGRNGRKEDLLPVAERFAAAGFNCVIPDLPAHGESPLQTVHFGADDVERHLPQRVLADARLFFHDNISPAGLWGLSMGGAFATSAATNNPDLWKTVVIVSSYDSLHGVIADRLNSLFGVFAPYLDKLFCWMAAIHGLNIAQSTPELWAAHIQQPVFIAHGDHDDLISITRGQHLFWSFLATQKTWVTVTGANHNNILVTEMPLYALMSQWLIEKMN